MGGDSADLLERFNNGDEDAGRELVNRYMHRVIPLARKYIGPQMQARFDPDDVAQSVFRSFFNLAANDRFELKRSGDLWRLLAAMTANKARKRVEYELAQKRTPERQVNRNSSFEILDSDPSQEEVELLVDEVRVFSQTLDPLERRILDRRLQDEGHASIAENVGCSVAKVRRVLRRIGETLEQQLGED